MSLNIVFMGTPEFSVPTLDLLVKNKYNVVKVYTQPPKKSKRGQKINSSPIEEYCKKNKISFRNPEILNTQEELKIFKELSAKNTVTVTSYKKGGKQFVYAGGFGNIDVFSLDSLGLLTPISNHELYMKKGPARGMVADNIQDVNTVLQKGFYHLYGAENTYY